MRQSHKDMVRMKIVIERYLSFNPTVFDDDQLWFVIFYIFAHLSMLGSGTMIVYECMWMMYEWMFDDGCTSSRRNGAKKYIIFVVKVLSHELLKAKLKPAQAI